MTTQTRYMTKRAFRSVDRDTYASQARNTLRLIAWVTKTPNVGSLCRLAEAFLADRLVGLKEPNSVAVGTSRWQPHDSTWDLAGAIRDARADGYTVVALEQTDASVRLGDVALPERMALLIGNEGSGLPQSALDAADMAVEIEQYGMVGSLNVATATAMALYEWSRQHRDSLTSVWHA